MNKLTTRMEQLRNGTQRQVQAIDRGIDQAKKQL